ncbi:MAG: signal peptidase I [Acidobacteriota bacterium]
MTDIDPYAVAGAATTGAEGPKSRPAAFLLSLVLPGAGELYAGRPRRAALTAFAWLVLAAVVVVGWVGANFASGVIALVVASVIGLGSPIAAAVLAGRATGPRRWWRHGGIVLVTALCGQLLVQTVVLGAPRLKTYRIPSASMEPTLRPGDHLVARVGLEPGGLPSRGELVIFRSPQNPESELIFRVVAVAGDRVEIRAKVLYLNDEPVDEPWAVHRDPIVTHPGTAAPQRVQRDHIPLFVVPPGHFFALGDNRDLSYDSRYFGPVPIELWRGRPLYLYWSRDRSRIGDSLRSDMKGETERAG